MKNKAKCLRFIYNKRSSDITVVVLIAHHTRKEKDTLLSGKFKYFQYANYKFLFLPLLLLENLIYYSAIAQRTEKIIRLWLGEREKTDRMERKKCDGLRWCCARDSKIVATPVSTIFFRDARGFRLRFG